VNATIRLGVATAVSLGTLAIVVAAAPQAPAPPTNVRVLGQGSTGSGGFAATGQRPYSANSPWNTPIPAGAPIDSHSASMVTTIASNGSFRSDPAQYTYPVYFADGSTPRVTMVCTGTVATNQVDGTRTSSSSRQMANVPIPSGVTASAGTDGQIIVIDKDTGDEYDIWRFINPNGCTNMTKYVRGVHRSAAETSYASRGAGVPYFAGLVRPWEIASGRIDHALAFAYSTIRSTRCVWPASKTDGTSTSTASLPRRPSRPRTTVWPVGRTANCCRAMPAPSPSSS